MTLDPIFSVNPDMEEVSNIRVANVEVTCDEDGSEISSRITPRMVAHMKLRTRRPRSAKRARSRGDDIPAAAVIEQTFEAGQPRNL